MTNKKLLMFAMAGAIAPVASAEVAHAESTGSAISVVIPEAVKDLAPTTNGRLRRTDQEQPGNEMPTFAFVKDANGKATSGLYFAMTTELNGTGAKDRIQLSATPFKLVQDPATGAVYAQADTAAAKFVTDNVGNERRNANAPKAMTINNGSAILVQYNYQKQGTNDTVTYYQVFNAAGKSIMPQTAAIAVRNDDCAMTQDGEPGVGIKIGTGVTRIVQWAGCNGNGRDDGWAFVSQITCDSEAAPNSCTFKPQFNVSLEANEERSRGNCTVAAADPSYAVCTWTAGNSQPQRNGVWAGAISLDAQGDNQQKAILWKTQVGGRIDNNALAGGKRTYAQRIIQERINTVDPTTGALVPSDKLVVSYANAIGRNNNKGTYVDNMVGVAQVSKNGLTWLTPPQNLAPVTGSSLKDLGRTHLGATAAMFANGTPGILFMAGSLNGGGGPAKVQGVAIDPASNQLKVIGATVSAPQDMHLYPNALGNNPGNQGRNHSHMMVIPNPYVNQNGSTSQYLLLTASTAKTMATTANYGIKTNDTIMKPEVKLTALMTVTPMGGMAATATVAGTPEGAAGNTDSGSKDSNASDHGTSLGGCQAGGGSTGFAMALLVGLAAFARRRR